MNDTTTDQAKAAADASKRVADLLATIRSANDAFEKISRARMDAIGAGLKTLEADMTGTEDELAAYGRDMSSDLEQETAQLDTESESIERGEAADMAL